MSAAFVPASTGRALNLGVNYLKRLFMGTTSQHAYNPSLAIHKTVPRGQSSRGVEVSATMGDIIVGYRC
jgi:hypothetical protein